MPQRTRPTDRSSPGCRWTAVSTIAGVSTLMISGALHAQTPAAQPSVSPAPSSSQPEGETAGMRFDRGVMFYKSGAFEMALVEFRRVYELIPNYRVLYNVGQTCFQLKDFACALRSFDQYLTEGGAEVPAERRTAVTAEISSLRNLVATVQVQVDDGATLEVDEVVVGRAPLPAPLTLNPGRHRISASKPGFHPAMRPLVVASSDKATLQLTLVPIEKPATPPAAPVAASAPTPVPPAAREPQGSLLWIGWVGAGALAAGSIVSGIMAIDASGTLRDERETLPGSRKDLDDARASLDRWSLAADILGGAALVTAGATLYFTLKQPSAQADKPASARIRLLPGAVQLHGTF